MPRPLSHPPALPLPPQPDFDSWPRNVTAQQAATLVSHYFGPQSDRTIRDQWPLVWTEFGGRGVTPTAGVFEPYATNAQAIARVCELWGRDDFHGPFIVEAEGDLWVEMELKRVIDGDDKGAPTRANLLRRCSMAVTALAENARSNIALTVWNGRTNATPAQRADRERRIEALAAELDALAISTSQGKGSYQQAEERFTALRGLGKSVLGSLVSDAAKAFVALEALPAAAP